MEAVEAAEGVEVAVAEAVVEGAEVAEGAVAEVVVAEAEEAEVVVVQLFRAGGRPDRVLAPAGSNPCGAETSCSRFPSRRPGSCTQHQRSSGRFA